MQTISGASAWRNIAGGTHSQWHRSQGDPKGLTAAARIAGGAFAPICRPKFLLDDVSSLFCIGSCFARNIEEHLLYREFDVRSLGFAVPRSEWAAQRPNGFVNKFTTASMLGELRDVVTKPAADSDAAFVADEDGWYDLQLSPGVRAVSLERAHRRRRDVREYFSRIGDADAVILTLGLVEAWYDTLAERYLNTAPTYWSVQREPDRFELHITDYTQNVCDLHEIVGLLGEIGSVGKRIVITVSPVPFMATFGGQDVVAANTYSKSVLRAAAEDVARNYTNVEYFPAYDALTTAERRFVYEPSDQLHVLDDAVSVMVQGFLGSFGVNRLPAHPSYRERTYLAAHPDVFAAIERGEFRTGYEHWQAYGRSEGRSLSGEPWA